MKIATFNINNVNKRLPNLLAWLRESRARRRLPAGAEGRADASSRERRSQRAGYGAAWVGQKTWNGVAILARGAEPVVTRTRAAGRSRRHAEPLHRGGGERRADRLALRAERQSAAGAEIRLQARLAGAAARHATEPAEAGAPVVLAGDYNVVPTDVRHLSDEILGRRRAGAAGKPRAPSRRSSSKAGPTRSATSIPTSRCTRSGTTCGTAGRATPGCGSIICC